MGIMILDRRIKAAPGDLIPLLKQAVQGMGWRMADSGKNQEGIISFSIFGRSPNGLTTLLPALGWITITGVQGESQVRIFYIGLNAQDLDNQKYLDEQPYDVTEMFIDIAAFLIRAVEGGKLAEDWSTQIRQTVFSDIAKLKKTEQVGETSSEKTEQQIAGDDIDMPETGFDIYASFAIPLPWDVLVAASNSCLEGYAPGFLEYEVVKQIPASITYRLWQNDLGELGTVEIRKLGDRNSEIDVSGVPSNSTDNAPAWLRVKPEWDKRIKDAVKEKKRLQEQDPEIEMYLSVSSEIDKAKARIKAKQKNHQANAIKAYFNRLVHDHGLWTSNKVIPPPYILALAGLTDWPDKRTLSQESQDYFEKYKSEISKSAMQQTSTERLENTKQKRGPQGRVEFSLKRLQQIRLDAIKNHRPIPTKMAAMDEAGITDKTWKRYAKELWDRWYDESYRQEKQE